MSRCFVVVGLALLAFVVPPAAATAPIPYIEEGQEYDNVEFRYMRSGYYEKPDPIGETCIRHVLCAGPFFPHIEYDVGQTGVLLLFNDTNVSAGHDPARNDYYGPYVLPSIVARDDIRVCWSGCKVPTPFFAHARSNVTVVLWAGGAERFNYTVSPHADVAQPNVIPDRFGCHLSNYGCEGGHAFAFEPAFPVTTTLP